VPIFGADHRLDRCFLHGRAGDALNLIGSAAGFNLRKLMSLMGRGIFSRALLAFRKFCRYLGSLEKFPSFVPTMFCRC
jgi:hypothetical protein